MAGMSDNCLAELPCGEVGVTDLDRMRNLKHSCIFKQGHHGMHYSKLSWNDAEFWWGDGSRYTQESAQWTA